MNLNLSFSPAEFDSCIAESERGEEPQRGKSAPPNSRSIMVRAIYAKPLRIFQVGHGLILM
jgi:hypothetical protein